MSEGRAAQIAGVASLADPVRRALYDAVVSSSDALSREQAAVAADVPRGTAAFHLDKLVAEGLLDVEYRRLTGRTGPGAGRPAKLYRRSAREIAFSVPPRRYDLAGRLLAEAVDAASTTRVDVRTALAKQARAFGVRLARQVRAGVGARASRAKVLRAVHEVLEEHGFEPRLESARTVLGNCPFHSLAAEHTSLVCGMNLDLMSGLADSVDAGLCARLDPAAGRCCVVLDAQRSRPSRKSA